MKAGDVIRLKAHHNISQKHVAHFGCGLLIKILKGSIEADVFWPKLDKFGWVLIEHIEVISECR